MQLKQSNSDQGMRSRGIVPEERQVSRVSETHIQDSYKEWSQEKSSNIFYHFHKRHTQGEVRAAHELCFHVLSMMTSRLIYWETINLVKIRKIFNPLNNVPTQRYIRHTRVWFQALSLIPLKEKHQLVQQKLQTTLWRFESYGDHTQMNLDDTFCFHVSQHLDDECDMLIVAENCNWSSWPVCEEGMRFYLESLRSQLFQFTLNRKGLTQWLVNGYKWGNKISLDMFHDTKHG